MLFIWFYVFFLNLVFDMLFFVFCFFFIFCVINLFIRYCYGNGGNGVYVIVKYVKFVNGKYGDVNGKNKKDGIINFWNGNNIFGINNRYFCYNGFGIDDWYIGNGLCGD